MAPATIQEESESTESSKKETNSESEKLVMKNSPLSTDVEPTTEIAIRSEANASKENC